MKKLKILIKTHINLKLFKKNLNKNKLKLKD